MAIPIINDWEKFFRFPHEGLGSSYERVVLNSMLKNAVAKYGVENALESPSFGFTGVSGINLMSLADLGVKITLEDSDPERLELIAGLWEKLNRHLTAVHNPDFRYLDHADDQFDLSFSFSALWFVPDLRIFLAELARVTGKVIFISVPNRAGIGYKLQLKDYSPQKYPDLKIGNIDPPSIISILKNEGWELAGSGFFDCPPWPDIGMTKEELLHKWLPRFFPSKKAENTSDSACISILDHYSGKDPGFINKMLRYQWFEKIAPQAVKRFWAHHYHMIFEQARK